MAKRNTLAQRIRDRRLALKLSQQEAADLAGIHFSEWSRFESGSRKNPQVTTLTKIAGALSCSVWALMPDA